MEREGFSRLIRGSDGNWYQMPTAEYNREGSLSIDMVRESAARAAASTGCMFAILVSESTSRAWVGLQVVQPSYR
jgi:hypothetical protein